MFDLTSELAHRSSLVAQENNRTTEQQNNRTTKQQNNTITEQQNNTTTAQQTHKTKEHGSFTTKSKALFPINFTIRLSPFWKKAEREWDYGVD
jgi:hypothetical protein